MLYQGNVIKRTNNMILKVRKIGLVNTCVCNETSIAVNTFVSRAASTERMRGPQTHIELSLCQFYMTGKQNWDRTFYGIPGMHCVPGK